MFLGCEISAVPIEHMSAIVRVESNANPFAIGVVGGRLSRQPSSFEEAIATVQKLKEKDRNFSVGLAQVNKIHFSTYFKNQSQMFDPCTNLQAGSLILRDCFEQYQDWEKAYSCYYSGNATTGFKHGYVQKVRDNFTKPILTELTFAKGDGEIVVLNGQSAPQQAQRVQRLSLSARRLSARLN